ncbi:hypothetical protein EMCRGX_G023397 [Ephydatia muelleri]|eukprot:Em0017g301a
MALLCPQPSPNRDCIVVACGETVTVAETTGEPEQSTACRQLSIGRSPVVCLGFSPSGQLLAVCADDKALKIWRTQDWEPMGQRVIPKRATAVQFTDDEQYILVADKTGEVARYSTADLSAPGSVLLGHSSIIVDMVLCKRLVITCDRDEKVRASNYPNCYNIDRFYLGHTDFISVLRCPKQFSAIVLSGSGDGTFKVWDVEERRLLHTEVCAVAEGEEEDVKAVTQLALSHTTLPVVVVVALEGSPELVVYLLSESGHTTPCPEANVVLSRPPWSCAFDCSDRLWVALPCETRPLECYALSVNGGQCQLKKLSQEDSPVLGALCKWDIFKGAVGNEMDWNSLRKQAFDNVEMYLAQKEERMGKKSSSPGAALEEEEEDDGAKPPKIVKLDPLPEL